ncbi:ATP-dependent DNA helicase RecG [Leeia oryzae]|uniref:ATP-dependent DNA helicase RecG n=1 Tax=Leeia oryzae TaxID=356662 RepID=UPI000368EF56|nr:ATP-dependent DNA helicase RecG [Leeia oryzae]
MAVQPTPPSADPFLKLPGFTDANRQKLAKLGLTRLQDLALHLPLRYEDETQLYPITQAPQDRVVVVEGVIKKSEVQIRQRRQLIAEVADSSGRLIVRFLNFYPSQQKQWQAGKQVRLIGEIKSGFWGLEMVHPRTRFNGLDAPLGNKLTPVYPTTNGLSQDTLQRLVGLALKHTALDDTLPASITAPYKLPPLEKSVRFLHSPPVDTDMYPLTARHHPAWRRLKFDELLAQQLTLLANRAKRREVPALSLIPKGTLTAKLLASLPFALTAAQQRVVDEICRDLNRTVPMQRLLQGDVGSGKTIVAALAALQAVENDTQAAFMAPTELLAEQHYRKLNEWLTPMGIRIGWLSGSQKKKERETTLAAIASGDIQIAVGTHALFQDKVQFQNLSLLLVDEQHRFGVGQRLQLRSKGSDDGRAPHQLMMSATPIPRTLAMSYFADLDVSVIDELPPGRTPIITTLLDNRKREQLIERVGNACRPAPVGQGAQAYWVCPLIEESETLQLQTAVATHETLQAMLPDLRIGLVHGKLPASEKQAVMNAFKHHELDILVATTVIEVGVDVPNATLMVIDHAERMGLAQLHQLRGRVGRGSKASYCTLLFQAPLGEIAQTRLDLMRHSTDGFEIAREDLHIRGPGELLGNRQSGVPLLRFADLEKDIDLLEVARNLAPRLLTDAPDVAAAHLERWIGNRTGLLDA